MRYHIEVSHLRRVPERIPGPEHGRWPPFPRVNAALIALLSLLLASPLALIFTVGVWVWEGWEQGLRALLTSAAVLALMFLHLMWLVERKRPWRYGRRSR